MNRKDTILTACVTQENRHYLRYVLSERFHLLESANLHQMLMLLEQNAEAVAAVVMGTSVIEEEGWEAFRARSVQEKLKLVPVVILNEKNDPGLVNVMFERGAADVIDLHYDAFATLRRIETVTQLRMHRDHLESLVAEHERSLRQSNDTMVDVLSSIIEYRSAESGHHVLRIRKFARILLEEVMRRCPEYQLTERSIDIISSASALHDVGKIAIPDAILTKPGPLTAAEWEIMKTHSITGCRILETLGGMADQEYLKYAKNICRYHHERWDGGGYPEGLVGDQIPICAQVVGLADAYEALTAERAYKEKCSFDQAINMILKGECGAFSPKLLACLKNVTESYEQLTNTYSDDRPLEEGDANLSLPVPDGNVSSLERVQAMYYSLVHYINGFLMEVSLDQGLFHVVYNPYPELAQLEGISTLGQLVDLMLDTIVVPEDRQRMHDLIFEGMPRFVEQNLRRSTHRFRYRELEAGQGGQFEMTLLRNGVAGSNRRALAILFRKVEGENGTFATPWYSLAESTYVCRNDQDFTLVSLDREASGLGGYTRQELEGQFHGRLLALIHPDDREMVRREFTRQLRRGTEVRLEHRVVLKSGNIMWVTNKSRLVVEESGQENLHCFLTDISETRNAYEALRQRFERYVGILNRTENVLFEWDMERDVMEFSDTWDEIFHIQSPTGKVRDWLSHGSHIHPDDIPLLLDRIINLENGSDQETQEIRVATDQGRYLWCRVHAHANRNDRGRLTGVMGVITSVEAEKQKERMLQDRAERDSLTKLLNKDAGKKKITDYLAHYPQGASCAMLIIDLDDFKLVNDQFGHLYGDAVLSKVGHEIKRHFKGHDIVCRIGGDEFLVLVRGLTDRMLLEERCRRLIASFCESLKAQNANLMVSCSIGIALAPEHGKTYYELFTHADQALYRAKAMGKNTYAFFERNAGGPAHQYQGGSTVSRRIDSDEEPGLAGDSMVRHAFKLLYSAKDLGVAMNEVISFLGKKMNVSRVYIFENSPDNRYCSNTFEWCNEGIEPQIHLLQNISYEEDIPGYAECLNEQGLLYCADIQELPQAIYNIVAPQKIKSMLHCAVRPEGVLQGYIGFDDCERHRMWTKEEIQMLTFFTEVLSMFLPKAREQEKTATQAQDVLNLLENQDTWIYIIDPDTWELKYLNRKARAFLPQAQLGCPCYQTIQGRSGPCPNCPSLGIREKKTDRVIRRNGPENLMFEATLTRWNGEDGCLMSCRRLPKEDVWETC